MEQGFMVVEDRDGVGKGLPERCRSRQGLGRYGHVTSRSVIVLGFFQRRSKVCLVCNKDGNRSRRKRQRFSSPKVCFIVNHKHKGQMHFVLCSLVLKKAKKTSQDACTYFA